MNRTYIKCKFFLACLLFLLGSCTSGIKANKGGNTLDQAYKPVHADTISIRWNQNKIGLTVGFRFEKIVQHAEDSAFSIGTNIQIPKLVNEHRGAKMINSKIEKDFETAIQQLTVNPLSDPGRFTRINFEYFVEDTLISLVVFELNAWHLSEGNSRYEVYHYDFKNDSILSTRDLLAVWGMSQLPLLNAIADQVTLPGEGTEPDFDSEWFETIKWKDINQLKLYRNNKKELTVIYPNKENGIESEFKIN
jgi:hypothetical protein